MKTCACILVLVLASAASGSADEARLRAELPRIKAAGAAHYARLLKAAAPQYDTKKPLPGNYLNGAVDYVDINHWIAGFFPGSLWKLYDLTKDVAFKDAAVKYTELLTKATKSRQHDIGFMLYCPMGEGLRLAPEMRERYARCLREGAETLASLYNEKLGLIRSWPWGNHLVIIDNMMNLELLEWAAKNGGPAKFDVIARSHATLTDRNHFRADGGTYHVLDYDTIHPGWVTAMYSMQGASGIHDSWSRGQGWAIYGFTMMYRETRDVRYLVRAMKAADYAIRHRNMPADLVPPYDFGVKPTVGPQPRGEADVKLGVVAKVGDCDRDASAAALMASALLELARYAPERTGRAYRDFAVRQVLSLASRDYFSTDGENGFLIKHFTAARPIKQGHPYLKMGTTERFFDCGVSYADYYFLEALQRFERWPTYARDDGAASAAELKKLGYADDTTVLDELMLARDRFLSKEWMGPRRPEADGYVRSQKPDGSWGDIDYSLWTRRNDAVYGTHFNRVLLLSRCAHTLGEKGYAVAALKGIDYWIDRVRGRNPNWWPNVIGLPKLLGPAALYLDDILTDAQRAKIFDYLACGDINSTATGGNLSDEAENTLRRAILGRDVRLFERAVSAMADEIRIAEPYEEGLQDDWSFLQHGAQQQMCTYGHAFLDGALSFLRTLQGTRWELPPEKVALLAHMVGDGNRWLVWKDRLDVASIGRGFAKGIQAGQAKNVRNYMRRLEGFGAKFAAEDPVGFKYFDRAAHAVYRTKGFMFSMRGSTARVRGLETHVMGMNKRGGHLTDGTLFTYVTGREYDNVYPLWHWRLLPGLTSYVDLKPATRSFVDEYNVSPNELDDMTGEPAGAGATLHYAFRRDGLSFVKDFVFSPTGVEVKVSGLSASRTDSRVTTAVEQALAQPDAKALGYADGCFRAVNGGIEYRVYAPEASVRLEIAEKTGDWRTMNTEAPSVPCKGRVFLLYVDHGIAPKDAALRYEILPPSGK